MRYRIAVGGIHIESSTFTPYISGYKDFKVRRGEELLQRYPWFEKYREKVMLLPLIHAGALPGGVVDPSFFNDWMEEFKQLLKEYMGNGGLDGILFDIHGAMSVQDRTDAEGYALNEIRKIVGNKVLISTSMDLHGNVSNLLFEQTDLITCYRTAPHIDTEETRERAFLNLIQALDSKERPLFKFKTDVPVLLPGEKTSTEVSPGKDLYELIPGLCDGEAVMDVAIWMGFPWADEERCHGVVTAVGFDEAKVKAASQNVGEAFFSAREQFKFVGPTDSLSGAVRQAINSKERPFFLSDTGDNPGAGGVGDMNLVLREFLSVLEGEKSEKKVLFASIFDHETIEELYKEIERGKKEGIRIKLGGKKDRSFLGPVELAIRVKHTFYDERAGRGALVQAANLFIIITEHRFQYGDVGSYQKAGITSFDEFDIIVVKMGYLEPDLSKAARGWVMALTPGAVSQDLINLPFKKLKRPLYPFDQSLGLLKIEKNS